LAGTDLLTLALALGALVLAPALGVLLALAPDWSFAYWIADSPARRLLGTFSVIATAAGPTVGLLLGRGAALRADAPGLVRWAAVPAVTTIAVVTGCLGRIHVVGTNAQFAGKFGLVSLAGSWLGHSLLWLAVCGMLAIWWGARHLSRPDKVTESP